ncbi:hypothetical protein FJNA_03970 [Thermus sp. FJN-A]
MVKGVHHHGHPQGLRRLQGLLHVPEPLVVLQGQVAQDLPLPPEVFHEAAEGPPLLPVGPAQVEDQDPVFRPEEGEDPGGVAELH